MTIVKYDVKASTLYDLFQSIFVCCLLYISTSVWVLHNPNTGRNSHFQHFVAKKLKNAKKVTNLQQNLAKNGFFKFAPKCWSSVLFPKKQLFLSKKKLLFTYESLLLWVILGLFGQVSTHTGCYQLLILCCTNVHLQR